MSRPLLSAGVLRPLPPPRRASIRRLLWALLVIVLVVVPGLFALEIAVMRHLGSRSAGDEDRPEEPDPAALKSELPPPPPEQPAPRVPPPPSDPSKEPPPPVRPPLTAAKPAPLALREALGGLTGSHLSQAHLNIGLIADAVEKELYTPEQGRKLLDGVADLLAAVGKKMQRLPLDSLPREEHAYLRRATAIEKLLRAQVEALRLYWDSGDKERADQFQKARKETWAELQDLLDPE